MIATLRGASAAAFLLSSLVIVGCSGGVSVPAAGTGSAVTVTPTPNGTTTTPTPTPVGVTTTAPATTPTPTPAGVTTTAPAATATPTSMQTTAAGCPPAYPPEPASSTTPWLGAGGNIPLPSFADLSGSVNVPSNSAKANTTLTFQLDQSTFTDEAGNGNIPTPPSGDTGILYAAAYLTPAQTITFGGTEDILITAKAPCEIPAGHTYVAFAYVNGGGFSHTELSPTAGYAAPQAADGSVSFTISLSSSGGLQPSGSLLETVFAVKN